MKKFTNKFVAAVASLAMAGTLCVAGAVTVSGVAWAKPNGLIGPPERPAPAPWEKFAPKKGTITILKCVEKTKDDKDASSHSQTEPQCKTGFKPLKDATFKLTKVTSVKEDSQYVDLDLSKFESWQKIAKLVTKLNDHTITDSGENAEITLGDSQSQSTSDKGIAKFGTKDSPIDLGLYKVEETSAPKGYGVSDLQSFYMTLPLPEYTTTTGKVAKTTVSYNYNPTVKPKNKDLSATIQKVYDKTKFASVKDKVPFTITAEVNKAKPKEGKLTADNLKGYKVFDDAPSAALTVQKPAGATTDPTLADAVKTVKIGKTTLEKGAATEEKDYKVTLVTDSNTDEGKDLAAGHTRILVTFTNGGLGKIADALNNVQDGQEVPKVTVDLEFELNKDYQGGDAPADGQTADDTSKDQIVNKSGFFQAHESNESDLPPIIPDNKKAQATIDFGFLDVHKYYMKDGKETDLSGAEFRIFADKDKADACAKGLTDPTKKADKIKDCRAASTISDATANAGASQPAGAAATDVHTATTNAEGKFTTPYKTRAGEPVYLVEVKAPTGYALSPVVHAVTVEKDKTTTEQFENFPLKGGEDGKSFWFNLPATGAYGVLIFALAGIGLIVASVILYVRNRKEEEQQQNA
ncbi:pilus assembly protein [Gardnerella vaginalis]|uniref:SpaH/EbpB family LPXTG-anchored major pilin n=1 Tax=Gardnerella vaginalis TaxID=2702 RepID=UPI000E3133CB|nr:SpaH/EbpB family LPXTG-anchored major pilin [Gardnerella vaginalis]RFD75867.1 pilus assembly protein [Gardnerella vaginalis]